MERRNVLVVEDEAEIRSVLMRLIRDNGWTMDGAENGIQGLARLKEIEFDVVLSDINMPTLSGLAFLNAVRLSGNNVPIIFLTASAEANHIKEALRLGAFDFIEKPVAQEDLVKVLARAINASQDQRRASELSSVEQMTSERGEMTSSDEGSMSVHRAKNNLKRD